MKKSITIIDHLIIITIIMDQSCIPQKQGRLPIHKLFSIQGRLCPALRIDMRLEPETSRLVARPAPNPPV